LKLHKKYNLQTELFNLTYNKNIPLAAVFELTHRCNLNCCHCYISEEVRSEKSEVRSQKPEARNQYELSTEEVKDTLKQLAAAGTLHLVFTGGEPFLRQDLLELCEYARKLEFDLRVFTNGTLIDNSYAEFLSEICISGIEISLYGRRDTHDSIVRVEGAFEKVLTAIEILKMHNIPITIKSPVMKLNFEDYPYLIDFAIAKGLKYKFDPVISPKNNGDKSVLRYQLTEKQLKIVFNDRRLTVGRKLSQSLNLSISQSLTCSAGRNFAGISPDGTVYPCIQFLYPLGNLHNSSFRDIWFSGDEVEYIRNLDKEFSECNNCAEMKFCRRCPGLVLLETKSLYSKSEIGCRLARVQKACSITFGNGGEK